MDAIYRVDGDRVVTGPNAAGPWDPGMQHGSAPASLVVWAAEAVPTPVPMRIARVTIDLMRPVPVAPLTLQTEILREGRKIQLCAVRLYAGGALALGAARGSFGVPGPGAIWYRADRPLVEGFAISQAMRAVVAADFCNGTSAVLDFRQWTFINADLTVSFARQPVGAWILLDAESWIGPDGAGLATARLADELGYFGRAVQ